MRYLLLSLICLLMSCSSLLEKKIVVDDLVLSYPFYFKIEQHGNQFILKDEDSRLYKSLYITSFPKFALQYRNQKYFIDTILEKAREKEGYKENKGVSFVTPVLKGEVFKTQTPSGVESLVMYNNYYFLSSDERLYVFLSSAFSTDENLDFFEGIIKEAEPVQ